MSRRLRHKSHANHERWLVSYADFITLLFAFFVVLYSSSQVDQRKVGQLSAAIQVAFQKLGVFPASTTQIPLDTTDPMPFNTVQAIENSQRAAALGRIASPPKGVLAGDDEDRNLSSLKADLEKILSSEIEKGELGLRTTPDGLVISLREVGFFGSGSAAIKSSSKAAISHIATLLTEHQYRVRIEGHTDNVPIHNSQFASNWELSTARATELIRLLITDYKFPPERLSAAGYAEYHPIDTNDTDEGKAMNRRVDVVVLGKQPSLSEHTGGEARIPSNTKPSPQIPPSTVQ